MKTYKRLSKSQITALALGLLVAGGVAGAAGAPYITSAYYDEPSTSIGGGDASDMVGTSTDQSDQSVDYSEQGIDKSDQATVHADDETTNYAWVETMESWVDAN